MPPHISPILDEPTLKRLAEELASVQGTPASTKSEWARWFLTGLITVTISVLAAYYTATTQISVNKETEQNHFAEVLRQLADLKADIRQLRDTRP